MTEAIEERRREMAASPQKSSPKHVFKHPDPNSQQTRPKFSKVLAQTSFQKTRPKFSPKFSKGSALFYSRIRVTIYGTLENVFEILNLNPKP